MKNLRIYGLLLSICRIGFSWYSKSNSVGLAASFTFGEVARVEQALSEQSFTVLAPHLARGSEYHFIILLTSNSPISPFSRLNRSFTSFVSTFVKLELYSGAISIFALSESTSLQFSI